MTEPADPELAPEADTPGTLRPRNGKMGGALTPVHGEAETKGAMTMRRLIALAAGLLALAALAFLPSTASAQYIPPPTLPETTTTAVLPDEETTTTTEAPTTTEEPTTTETTDTDALPDEVKPPAQGPAVSGDVVSRPLPRTGNDIGGTAIFGGALTVLGIALAFGARKRRNSFDGA